jgi:hypothetical protein
MTKSQELRDHLADRLVDIVKTSEELQPAMVSACVNFLKQFPPADELEELPAAKTLAKSLEAYAEILPFKGGTA